LPHQSDHSDGSDHPSTLPLAELNPLVNPLLAANMGRWAEVYFRTPPENREQAILELLQELQAANSRRPDDGVSPQGIHQQESYAAAPFQNPLQDIPRTDTHLTEAAPTAEALPRTEDASPSIRCAACRHENAAGQRFCGMCGMPLQSQPVLAAQQPEAPGSSGREQRTSPPIGSMSPMNEIGPERLFADDFLPPQERSADLASSDGLIRSLDYGSSSRSYRAYVGVALVVVVLALGYMAWRSTQASSGSSPLAIQAPPSAPVQSAQQPAPEVATAPKANPPAAENSSVPVNSQPASSPSTIAKGASANGKVTPTALVSKDQGGQAAPPATGAGDGSQELAIARSYLNGSNGAEAADWLWKAVAKGNTDATVELSDLYLRGTGIPKNCDQARVLLDAAASRGVKAAAMRLQNMQAFGCP
jgi:hypothetical protein